MSALTVSQDPDQNWDDLVRFWEEMEWPEGSKVEIIEGIITTLGLRSEPHVAPMGPEAECDFRRLVLKPFRSTQTYQNLRQHPEGVFHLVDDVELLARAAIGPTSPPVRPAEKVRGWILLESCRYFEFRVERIDDREERTRIECEVVASGRLRDFSGFNRARHAVVEAAILATRAGFLPVDGLRAQLAHLAVSVEKTGGPRERAAFDLLRDHVERIARSREAGGAPASAPAAVRVRAPSRLHFGLSGDVESTLRFSRSSSEHGRPHRSPFSACPGYLSRIDMRSVRGVGVGGLREPAGVLDFGNAGTGSRLMMPGASFSTGYAEPGNQETWSW